MEVVCKLNGTELNADAGNKQLKRRTPRDTDGVVDGSANWSRLTLRCDAMPVLLWP